MKNKIFALQRSATKSALPARLNDSVSGSLIALCLLSSSAAHSAEQNAEELPDTTIIANRIATPLSQVGSSVSVLDVSELEDQGILQLDEALKFVPGLTSDSVGGQKGSTSDLYIRGLRTTHTHIVVDGMRISDTNSGLVLSKQFLGSSNLSGLSHVEILRGPQGALYGGDSIGGVLGLYSKKGDGAHSGSLRTEAGSFSSLSSTLQAQGTEGDLSYSFVLGDEQTDNDLSHNTFEMYSYALRLDYKISDQLNLGLTLRGADSTYEGPQVSSFYSGPDDTDFNYTLGTLFAQYQANDIWSSKLTLGIFDQESDFVSRAPTPGFPGFSLPTSPPTISYANNESLTKYGAYWDNTIQWNTQHTTITGLVYEKSDYLFTDSLDSKDDRERKQHGLYANHIWNINDHWTTSGGLRWEDYSDNGNNGFNDGVFTWRFASAYTLKKTDTTLRSSLGHGFRIPNSNELNGNPAFGIAANPDLDPVESLGWDLGIEQGFCDGKYKLAVTYFANRLENAIISTGSQYTNTPGVSETSGIEASAEASFLDDYLNIALTYTWLDRSLVDIPDNTAGLHIYSAITERLQAGLTASYLDQRSYGGNSLPAYYILNLYGNYRISDNASLNLRVENLLDKKYEYYNGFGSAYPGRGIGIFGGVTIEW
ncbi:MAG: TonB-dependent receptor plug domain-containing protein [Akkermansiaceae bacterium]